MSKAPKRGQRSGAGQEARPAGGGPLPAMRLDPDVYQRLYGMELTEAERRLLTTSGDLLGPYERQAAYLLKMSLRAEKCPACQYVLCPRSAWTGRSLPEHPTEAPPARPGREGLDIDTSWAADGEDGHLFACPNCRVRLIHHLGIVDTDHWFTLAPGQVVEVTLCRAGMRPATSGAVCARTATWWSPRACACPWRMGRGSCGFTRSGPTPTPPMRVNPCRLTPQWSKRCASFGGGISTSCQPGPPTRRPRPWSCPPRPRPPSRPRPTHSP